MAKNNQTVVDVTDEGNIMINYLPTDYKVLFNLIISKSCRLNIASAEGYHALSQGMRLWMWDNITVEEYQEVMNFMNSEYKASVEQINL